MEKSGAINPEMDSVGSYIRIIALIPQTNFRALEHVFNETERRCQSLLSVVTALVSLNPHGSQKRGSYNIPIVEMRESR